MRQSLTQSDTLIEFISRSEYHLEKLALLERLVQVEQAENRRLTAIIKRLHSKEINREVGASPGTQESKSGRCSQASAGNGTFEELCF